MNVSCTPDLIDEEKAEILLMKRFEHEAKEIDDPLGRGVPLIGIFWRIQRTTPRTAQEGQRGLCSC